MNVDLVVMTAWNRPGYLDRALRSWDVAMSISRPVPFRIHLEPGNDESRRLASEFTSDVVVNERRLGVLENPFQAMDRGFREGARFVVLAEEDVVVAPDVLRWLSWAAGHFRDRSDVGVVCAFQGRSVPNPREDGCYLDRWFSPLVWGTWADRWEGGLRDTWDHDYSSGTREDPQSGWDANIGKRVLARFGWSAVFPEYSRSQHIGEHGGAHCTAAMYEGTLSPVFMESLYRGGYEERDDVTARQEAEYWDGLARSWGPEKAAAWVPPEEGGRSAAQLADAVGLTPKPGEVVLELGCGHGRILDVFAGRYRESRFVGVDSSVGMLAGRNERENVDFIVGDGRTIPCGDKSIDAAYAVTLFQHLDDKAARAYLGELWRVLRPGGRLVFQFVVGEARGPFAFCRPVATVEAWLAKAGFTDVEVVGDRAEPLWAWASGGKP